MGGNSSRSAGPLVVEKLSKTHDLSGFDCGKPALNDWLRRYALQNQAANTAVTYVVRHGKSVVGYYALAYGSVAREEVPERVAKGIARHPVPVVVLARLAVHEAAGGQGLGKALLKDALLRISAAADIAGARAVLVHAIDDQAQSFYAHFDFEPSPVDELTMMLLMKDLRAMIVSDDEPPA